MNVINKITGRDISTEYLGLMMGLITSDEFELITMTIRHDNQSYTLRVGGVPVNVFNQLNKQYTFIQTKYNVSWII